MSIGHDLHGLDDLINCCGGLNEKPYVTLQVFLTGDSHL